ncbi:hypothetical protein [Streptomyces sp. NPDC050738]|uniref:hypothetical protein n=1 Tax=Streptomyces sp. NPDC050738 TaxID=3154744 RepID=UPI0034421930
MTEPLTGGEAVARALSAHGVTQAFGVPRRARRAILGRALNTTGPTLITVPEEPAA